MRDKEKDNRKSFFSSSPRFFFNRIKRRAPRLVLVTHWM